MVTGARGKLPPSGSAL